VVEHVVVSGGGIAGTTAALALATAGIAATVVETHPADHDGGAVVRINPNGMDALRAIGVHQAVIAESFPLIRSERIGPDGQRVGYRIAADPTSERGLPRVLHWSRLAGVLRAAAYRLGLPTGAINGQVMDLTDVLGTGIRRLADQLRYTPDQRQQFALLDAYLLRRAQDGPQPAPEVAWAWRRMTATGGKLLVGRLAKEVGWSHRHLISRFKQQVGLPPKTAARLVRFDTVWRRLATHPPVRWDQIADECGYADQAHLIRDFHQFTGVSPAAFLANVRARDAVARPA
jgi:AraC-like DNA-binding protein